MIDTGQALVALGVTNFILNGSPTSEAEFLDMFRLVVDEPENEAPVLNDDPADFPVTWAQVEAKVTELEAAEPLRLLREERNRRIAETDWWVLPDLTPTDAQLAYRQALRDITNTYTSLDDVVWPEKPE